MINYDLKFLVSDESVTVNDTDLNTLKYETKKKSEESVYDSGKRSYCERRGGLWRGPRSRVFRELVSNLRDRSLVYSEWMNDSVITLVFSSGSIAYLTINPESLDVTQVLFDRYCVGKLSGNPVTAVVFTPSHILFTHAECTATLITFGTSKNVTSETPLRLADRNPHVQSVELSDGARRGARHVSCGGGGGGVLVWTAAAAEPAPWAPQHRAPANLHLYRVAGQQLTVAAYHQLAGGTLAAHVARDRHDTVHVLRQHAARKGGVSLSWLRYAVPETTDAPLRLSSLPAVTSRASLPAPARVTSLACVTSARLAVGCVDGSLHVLDAERGLTHTAKAAFVPVALVWAGGLLLAAEDGARLQCFDAALQELRCLHLRECPRLPLLCARAAGGGDGGGGALLLRGGGAALALLRLTSPPMPQGWLRAGRMSRAVSWLRARDWRTEGDDCLRALHLIANYVWRQPLTAAHESALQTALGSYLTADDAPEKYRASVTDLARKFYHHLLRRGRLDKALSLAVDVAAPDLFADARGAAHRAGRAALADEAHHLALQHHTESPCCSSCSCSGCGSGAESPPPAPAPAPPLPRLPPPAAAPAPQEMPDNKIKRNVKWHSMDDVLTDTPHISRHRSLVTVAEHPWPSPEPPHAWQPPSQHWQATEQPWTSAVIDVLPRPYEDHSGLYGSLYQRELREEAPSNMYRYGGAGADAGRERRAEKNVKFSDTVTIAVAAAAAAAPPPPPPPGPSPLRELAESLPLCAPHRYLAAFERRPPRLEHPAHPADDENAAQKPPKVKVVHFGLV